MINSPLTEHKQKNLDEADLEEMHHNIMELYGWIPLEEFKKLPLPTLFSLHNKVIKELNKKEELRLYALRFYGVKNPK